MGCAGRARNRSIFGMHRKRLPMVLHNSSAHNLHNFFPITISTISSKCVPKRSNTLRFIDWRSVAVRVSQQNMKLFRFICTTLNSGRAKTSRDTCNCVWFTVYSCIIRINGPDYSDAQWFVLRNEWMSISLYNSIEHRSIGINATIIRRLKWKWRCHSFIDNAFIECRESKSRTLCRFISDTDAQFHRFND